MIRTSIATKPATILVQLGSSYIISYGPAEGSTSTPAAGIKVVRRVAAPL